MSNTTIGSGAKKETVYSGPTPQPKQSSGSSASTPSGGSTVYGGSAPKTAGTIYNGLGAGSTVYGNQEASATVYNPARQNAAARPAQTGANAAPSRAGSVFFIIAGFSAINTVLLLASAPFVMAIGLAVTRIRAEGEVGAVLAINAVVIGIFVALGFFASRGSKAAFIIGLLLYAGDTALLLLDNPALHVVSIIVHGIFLFSIFKGLRQLS